LGVVAYRVVQKKAEELQFEVEVDRNRGDS
jgi:hypothetical protein